MYIKDFDQLSFEYNALKGFLLNSCKLEIDRIEFKSPNGGIGETIYICNKIDVSGSLEAFVVLYYRYLRDSEEWGLELTGENLAYVLDFHIVQSLRAFNFDFQSYEHTINYISKYINALKEPCPNENRKVTVFKQNDFGEGSLSYISLLDEISAPTKFAILKDDYSSKLYLFETLEKYVLFDSWASD